MESHFQESTFIFLIAIGILIMLALALSFVLFVSYSQKKLLTAQMHNQQLDYQHQRELLHSTILTQEQERKRIARELHDDIGSKLNIIFLNMHRLNAFTKLHEEVSTITQEVNELIHTTINTTRRISHDLLPPTLEEFGLIEAIKELKYNIESSGKAVIQFEDRNAKDVSLDKTLELHLYRVLQELVNNSIRHGKAAEIQIHLSIDQPSIQLAYQDNGQGFDMETTQHKQGLGIKNIKSRLQMINAVYQYRSTPGEGTSMQIEISDNNQSSAS